MRKKSPDRLEAIAEAALATFMARGYKQTQMADAARLAGVSAGTLYLYAENKEALFELALRRALDEMPAEDALPLRGAGQAATLRLLAKQIPTRERWPALTAALSRRKPRKPPEELASVVEEFFDALSRQWRLIALLDANAWDLPELAKPFARLRATYFADIAAYVARRRADGTFAFSGDTMAITRAVVESIIWLAMDRRRDPAPTGIDDAAARAAAVVLAQRAWLGAEAA